MLVLDSRGGCCSTYLLLSQTEIIRIDFVFEAEGRSDFFGSAFARLGVYGKKEPGSSLKMSPTRHFLTCSLPQEAAKFTFLAFTRCNNIRYFFTFTFPFSSLHDHSQIKVWKKTLLPSSYSDVLCCHC